MRLLEGVRLPIGLDPGWTAALESELETAQRELPTLSAAALELAELAVSNEYDAEIVGAVLERDEKLNAEVLRMANSPLYAAESPIKSSAAAAQRIGMRALWEIAVVDVARLKVFGPALGQVLGGSKMWGLARLSGVISQRLSASKLGKNKASILAGLILCVGPPLAHQLVRRAEVRARQTLPSRIRSEVTNRLGPKLCVMLVRAWSLADSIAAAATSFADGRGEAPDSREGKVAVFSVSLARYITARGTDSLGLCLRWPTAVALEIDAEELAELVSAASSIDDHPIGF